MIDRFAKDEDVLIGMDGITLDLFDTLKGQYPHLVFDDRNDKGVKEKKAVFIYPNDRPRRGNVFIAVYQHRDCFDFVMKRSIMTEEEKSRSSQNWKRDTSLRGCVRKSITYKSELINYLIPKLEMIEAAK